MKRFLGWGIGLLMLPGLANAWWNDDWKFRKEVKLDSSPAGANLTAGVADVPVLIRLHSGNFGYFGDTRPDGADLRFLSADDKTPLFFAIEKYDPANEMALVWVRVPRISVGGAPDSIWMYYGNSEAPAGSDKAALYDRPQVMTYHFDLESGPKDATAYNIQPRTSQVEFKPASLIGGGVEFKGQAGIEIAANPALQLKPDQGFTFSAWIKPVGQDGVIFAYQGADQAGVNQDAGISQAALTLETVAGSLKASLQSAGTKLETAPSQPLIPDTWHHVGLSILADTLVVYLDGVAVGSVKGTLAELTGEIRLGTGFTAGAWMGEMDQAGMAVVARDAAWFAAAVASQSPSAKLLVLGEDEQFKDGASASSFGYIVKSLTIDGWVVIAILMVMTFISWWIMAAKAMMISNAGRQNSEFMEGFRKLSGHSVLSDALIKQSSALSSSSLFCLYERGFQEARARLGRSVGAAVMVGSSPAGSLSSGAIEAIKTSIDAVRVRELQRLNSQMVLLTIAISGGPFLGLLGTVVGVMITFASVGQSGDVNINTIAPGMASALLATVAGLVVAIPALFGYNYFASQIKEISADMNVFADEFTGRLNEEYGN